MVAYNARRSHAVYFQSSAGGMEKDVIGHDRPRIRETSCSNSCKMCGGWGHLTGAKSAI